MPHSYPDSARIRASDIEQCRSLLRGGSRTFYSASLVLPRRIRDPATALYAFCRLADDGVDEGAAPTEALLRLRERLNRIYGGQSLIEPIDRAFAAVIERFAIPQALPEAMIEGFEWDAAGRRYETLSDVYAYSARVAGTVGTMMSLIMGARAPEVLARACELGVAMQLTNIARDVGEDARARRLYIPLDWLQQAGIDPERWLEHPEFNDAIAGVVQRLLDVADQLYVRSATGIAWLPAACRPGMHAARLLYAEIGREVERNGLNSVAQRARVAAWRKSTLLLQATMVAASPKQQLSAIALDEVRFLLDAVNASVTPELNEATHHPALWLLELFERLERRQLEEQSQ